MKQLSFLIIMTLISSCSSTSSLHKGKNGTKICISSLNNIESSIYQSILKELPSEKIDKHRVFNGGVEERGFNIYQIFGIDHHSYFIRYFPVIIKDQQKGFVIKGKSSGTMMTGPSNLSSIISNSYNMCSNIVEVRNYKHGAYTSYYKESLLADGKTWEIYSSSSDFMPFIMQRGKALCGKKPEKIFGCSTLDGNPTYKAKCYVKCK